MILSDRSARRIRRLKRAAGTAALTLLLLAAAAVILTPTVLTVTNSFMSTTEITSNYGAILGSAGKGASYFSKKCNLKFIPDIVSGEQFFTVLLRTPDYLYKFWNSVALTVPITLGQIAVALGAAYFFARFESRFRSALFFVYIVLMLMPYQVTLIPNYLVADKLGILYTRAAIILPGIFAPFAVFILTKFMRRIPKALVEAAKLDGAGEWTIFTRVYIPQCTGVTWSVAILIFIDYWNMVEQPLVLLRDDALRPLSVFLAKINTADTGVAFAVAVVYMVLPLLLFLYGEDYLIEGISYSSGIK
jgi:multiple sugar transport system permease protein